MKSTEVDRKKIIKNFKTHSEKGHVRRTIKYTKDEENKKR